jgi:hypothetical protein
VLTVEQKAAPLVMTMAALDGDEGEHVNEPTTAALDVIPAAQRLFRHDRLRDHAASSALSAGCEWTVSRRGRCGGKRRPAGIALGAFKLFDGVS